jgi:UDP-glucose 6-dehydrogenase
MQVINKMADLCEKVGAEVQDIAHGTTHRPA